MICSIYTSSALSNLSFLLISCHDFCIPFFSLVADHQFHCQELFVFQLTKGNFVYTIPTNASKTYVSGNSTTNALFLNEFCELLWLWWTFERKHKFTVVRHLQCFFLLKIWWCVRSTMWHVRIKAIRNVLSFVVHCCHNLFSILRRCVVPNK